jgi:spore germination protein KA
VDKLHQKIIEHSHEDIEIRLGFLKRIAQDDRFAFLPLMLVTERPDRVKAYLAEGKIALIIQDMADVIILPVSFWAFFQSIDDYNMSWAFGSMIRLLRFTCFLLTLVLPALYISVSTFIPYLIPTEIALTLQSSLQYIAMPPIVEVLFMLLTLEIIREASIRLASPIGQTIGVVGGIILGTAVVQSNLVSTMAIIIASFTGLASFVIPSYEMNLSVRLITYPIIFSAQLFGLVGIVCCMMVFIIHLCRMKTLGSPYYQATFPFIDSMRDTLYRPPNRNLVKRSRKQPPTK